MFARDKSRDLYKSPALAALLALSLGQMPAARAGSITDMVKGAFVSTGEAIKNTAKAGGEVLRGTARVGGEAIAGTAHMGEAAAVATGKAIGTTTGAVAGVTGDIITGSAKAVGTTSEAAVGATEDMLGMHKKNDPSRAVKTSSTSQPGTSAAPTAVQAIPQRVPQAAPQASTQTTVLAPLPSGNTTAVHSEVAIPRSVPQVPSAFARTNPPMPSAVTSTTAATTAATSTAAATSAAPVKQTATRPATKQAIARPARPAAIQQPLANTAPNQPADTAPLANISDQAILDKVLSDKPAGKVSRRNREALQNKPEMTDAQELQSLAPAQISNDITEGTRIAAPVEDSYVSPSWNQQQPIATSAAFAAQYTLHTTPLKATPAPPTAPGAAQAQPTAPVNAGAPLPNGLR
ncbi:MAG: hypothetical protein KGS72_24055 [Cyanobacteria bacterium REEB67]|nr:hypothetical protein [Cyanobacteria bacterium REEB67]